ncbi:MAG TPA: class I SAM-dependent methyltransferase [Candidatus Saccharimonadales bacterium]|nr:class I SAM-dependent methyltransferase [Candidatus Saccharimonadales bacterium]
MDITEKYNKTAKEYAESRIGTEDTAELAKLQTLLRPGSKVLDVGCAAGRDTGILKDMGFAVVGSDLADKLLDIAKQTHPDIEFVLADMRQLPFADKAFSAIWASAVLHHVTKTEMPTVLREFRRVLAPQGLLYIHTKAGQGVLRTKEETVKGEGREFELVTAKELHEMLQSVGFTRIELEEKPSKSRPGLFWVNAFYRRA